MRFGTVLVIFLIPYAALAGARSALSLRRAILIATSRSPEIKALQSKRDILKDQRIRAWAPAPPEFSVDFGDLEAPTGSHQQNERVYHLTQNFGFPGEAASHARFFNQRARATDFEIVAEKLKLKKEVTLAFNHLEALQSQIAIQEQNRLQLLKLKRFARQKMAVNTSSEVEYLLIQSEWLQTQNQISDLRSQKKDASRKLNLLLGRRLDSDIQIEKSADVSPHQVKMASLESRLESQSPALKAAKVHVQAAQTQVNSAQWSLAPDFTFGVAMSEDQQTAETLGVRIPLWFWWDQRPAIQAAYSGELHERMKFNEAKRRLVKKLSSLALRTNREERELELERTKLIPWSQRAMKVAWRNYRYGTIVFSTLQAAQQNQVQTKITQVLLLRKYKDNVARIDALIGIQ